MAAKGRSDRRVEPSFEDEVEDDEEFRLDSDDRIGGQRKTSKRARSEPKSQSRSENSRRDRGKPAKASKRKDRRDDGGGGLFAPLRRLIYWCVVLGIWAAIGVGGLVLYYGAQMPAASTWSIPDRPPNMKITAIDGSVIANRGTTGGEALSLEQMSPYLPQAVISIEDRRFYSHFGVDPFGLARAFVNNLTGQPIQGGSTITQQLAKNLFLSPDRTFERKIQEVLLSFWLEHKFSKDQILAMYLNRVFFGSSAYGVEAASRRYFNKSAQEISLGEAATLAGLLKAPSRLSPARDPEAAKERAKVVLGTMREEGYITDSDYNTAMAQPPAKAKSYWSGPQHYAADMVVDEVKSLIGEPKVDVTVETTIDTRLEDAASKSLNDILDKEGKKLNASQAALVSVDATGAIRAVVGGRDYAESQFNRAAKAKRQPGSAFKPFVYAAALEGGYTPDTIVNDAPVRIGNWTPENYEKEYKGPVPLSYAMAHSLNTVAAQLVMAETPEKVISLAHRLGVDSDIQPNASIALGTSEVSLVELTSSYASFMNGGYKATPHIVKRITDPDGKVLYEADYSNPPRVLSEPVAAAMNSMMNGVVNSGTSRAARLDGWQVAGKSGTTQSFRDALFVGYTSIMTTGIWFGNDDGTYMKKVTGGGLPAKAWKEYMTTAMHGYSPTPLFGFSDGLALPPATEQEQSPSTSIGDIISGIIPGSGQQQGYPSQDAFPPAPAAPSQQASPQPQVPGRIPDRSEAALEQPTQRRGNQQPYPEPARAIPCPYGDNAVCNNGGDTARYDNRPPRDYRDGGYGGGNVREEQGSGYRDYRQYRGPYDAGGPVPPGDVGGGMMPPADVGPDGGHVYQPQQTRRTTLLDVIMGQ
ncbi:penicillin-binding protein [Aliirhizobium terrae]|uniref:transglycosylase domain-containing protein n=1 Tax=Terrirhizobium terrae TaxID=2926709 RepID=UPI002578F2F7|nr:transglycosylase domain-containing protein [Rhizobium sp. CC-CFT758]WJH41815.1 penicillin-binding protein [Rhizobium sp. CC-CFT758]